MVKIGVLGAGINGIASALAIQKISPKSEITIIADKFSPETTSDVAAGFIEPYLCGDDEEKILKWTKATVDRIQEYLADGNAGAEEMSGYWIQSVEEKPKWLKIMKNVNILNEEEMKMLRKRSDHKFAVFYTTWYLEPTAYIKYCTKKFVENGGHLKTMKIVNISEVSSNFDILVNCTGLGSRKLFNDESIRPCRGQVMRVSCPPLKHFMIDDNYYALLNDNCVILGGTKIMDDYETDVRDDTAKRIFEENCVNNPCLKNAKILSHHVGLRPCRPTVRLEVDYDPSSSIPIVHNYGHGGSGITIHWGCAIDTAQLVFKEIERIEKPKL